ncbi:MAG: DUF4386 domain-containing protein, partial [Myxococcales bacterium]|nr:DUF4386 domain-containing protein [Myxococcales bacterium]
TQAVQLATGGPSADALGAGAPGLVLSSMEVHALTYDLGLVFFGLSCLVLGWLLRRSGSVPALLAIGVSVAGVVYLVGSFAALCVPAWSAALDPAYGVAFLAELAFAVWLVAEGMAPRRTPSEAQVVASGA